jgi:hypothetical protein
MTKATASAVTVPNNTDVAFAVGTNCDIIQMGAGQVSVVAAAGVTLDTSSTLKLRQQYSAGTLLKVATNEWVWLGDTEPPGQTIQTKTANYTLAITDAWTFIEMSAAGALTLTIPANSVVAFPIGTHVDIGQWGAGQVTVAITTDTLRATPTAKLRAQYSTATLIKVAATEWAVMGDMAAS